MTLLERVYLRRDPVAWTGGVLVLLTAALLRAPPTHERVKPDVELLASVDLPAPPLPMPAPPPMVPVVPPPPPPVPVPPVTTAVPPPPVRVEALPPAEPVRAAAADLPVLPAAAPVAATAQRPETQRAEAPRPVHDAPHPAPPVAPAAEAVPAPHLAQQAGYEGTVLAYLEKIKHYPTSREARQSHPTGTVRIWLELARSGQVLAAGVQTSSGSNLLDNEALRTVKAATFPPFPDSAFAGEVSHRFVAGLKYEISDGS